MYSKVGKVITTSKVSKFKRLKGHQVKTLQNSVQEFSDCYLMSSLDALTQSQAGRNILSKNIKFAKEEVVNTYENTPISFDVPSYQIKFNNVYDKAETYVIDSKERAKHSAINYTQKNPIAAAMEIAMHKLIFRHPFKKNFLSRIHNPFCKNFEYNKPSNFMEMFTGKKPIIIAESDINFSLTDYKDEVMPLLEKMSKTPKDNYSFVAGTGLKKLGKISNWHCLVIEHVNWADKTISLKNKRTNYTSEFTFDEAIKKLKFIVGYFNEHLK